jgi:PAS domain S-box-containing protein
MKTLLEAKQRLPTSEHFCSIYREPSEQLASLIPFLRTGLERGERCLYIAENNHKFARVVAALNNAGLAGDAAVRSRALILSSDLWSRFQDVQFDLPAVISLWKSLRANAFAAGHTGMRAAIEMNWIVLSGAASENWMGFERRLTIALAETGCVALCQYDQQQCAPSIVLGAIRSHPMVVSCGTPCENFYFVPPEDFAVSNFTGHEVERRLRNLRDREQTVRDLKLFRTLIDRSNDAIEVVDPETLLFLDVNEKACVELGYSRDELLKLSVFDIDSSMTADSVANIQNELRRVGVAVIESVHRRKDGSTFPVEVNLRRVDLDRSYVVNVTRNIADRKRMIAALREREDHYRDLVEHSSDLICTHDLDGRILSVNEAATRILGYTREEVLNTPMPHMIPPEWRQKFDDYINKIRRDGVADGLLAVLTKSGERRIWEYHNTLRTEGIANPIVRGIAHDVTDQKRAEQALRASEEKFSKAFRSNPVNMAIVSRTERRIIDVNECFERETGIPRAQAIGHNALELGLYTVLERDAISRAIDNRGRIRNHEVELHSRCGESRTGLYSAEPIEIGGVECLLVACRDITERKVAEKKLQLSEEKFAKAFRASPEMMLIVSLDDGRFIEVNGAFERQLGYSREEIIGHTEQELNLWLDSGQRNVLRQRMLTAGHIRDEEVQFRARSGGLLTVLVSTETIELEGQRCLLAVGQDITALKRTENQLREITGRVMASQEEERRRIARELHDSTAQQLTGIRMTLGTVKRSVRRLSPKALQAVAECQELAEQCAREIRTLSYLLHPPLLDEFGLLMALRGYIEGFGKRSGLRVTLEADQRLEQSRFPPDLETTLFRIVQEGLTNVNHHSGSFSASVCLKQTGEELFLSIRDHGHGIDPAIMAATRRGDTSSLGVGLPGMRERVRQLGGDFQLESGTAGTSILVVFPLKGSGARFAPQETSGVGVSVT